MLQALPAREKVRLVEIGSGSGGTSVVVMEALAEFAERVELTYTDISPQLVTYGRKTYGPKYPFVHFHLLDVEKDVAQQVRLLLCTALQIDISCRVVKLCSWKDQMLYMVGEALP